MFKFYDFFDITLGFGQFMSMPSTRQAVVSIFIELIDAWRPSVDKVSIGSRSCIENSDFFTGGGQHVQKKLFLEHEFFKGDAENLKSGLLLSTQLLI